MSEYKCWITDFPQRCGQLLRRFEDTARWNGREITLLFAVASACIAIPYDRVRVSAGRDVKHPLHEPDDGFSNLANLLQMPVKSLPFWEDGSIPYGRLASVDGQPEQWPELQSGETLGSEKQFSSLIMHVRNALAHGSVHTRGNPIAEIVMLSRKKQDSDEIQLFDFHTTAVP